MRVSFCVLLCLFQTCLFQPVASFCVVDIVDVDAEDMTRDKCREECDALVMRVEMLIDGVRNGELERSSIKVTNQLKRVEINL